MAGNTIRFSAWLDDKVSKPLAKIRDQFDTLGKSKGFKQVAMGVGMGAGISAYNMLGSAISGAFEFAQDSIAKASALNETLSKSNVVFGSSAAAVASWGGTLAKNFGISKQAGIEAAASFGNVFTNIGMTNVEAAKMSERLVMLAGDLASFNDIATGDALEKLRAGLAGEAEPLRSVGVFLTEAKVKAKAMELGLADAHGELSEGAKITARYQLILEQTTKAQGDYARTADGAANSQRGLNAQMDDAQAELGQKLLPAQLAVTRAQITAIDSVNLHARALEALGNQTRSYGALQIEKVRITLEDAKAEQAAKVAAENAAIGVDALSLRSKHLAREARLAGDGVEHAGDAADKAVSPFHDLHRQVSATASDFGTLTSNAQKWSDWVYGEVAGEGDLKDQLSLTNDELRTAKRHLRELQAIDHPTRAQRLDLKETRVKVNDLQQEVFDLNAQLAALGNKPSRDAIRPYLDSLKAKLDKGLITAQDYRDALTALGQPFRSSRQTGKDSRKGRHATGGILRPGDSGTINEAGPERLVMLGGSAMVIPNQSGGGGGSGGGAVEVPITIHLDGDVIYRSVERRQVRDFRSTVDTV